jgi:hypothetical protein
MRRLFPSPMLAALIMLASACSRTPAPPAIQHPPVDDLVCTAEPPAPAAQASEIDALHFDAAVLIAGRSCREALARACRWHVERGMAGVTCD